MLVRYMGESSVSLRASGPDHSHPPTLIAVNYRLTPQYPFPCAIQDLLATCEPRHTSLSVKLRTSLDIFLIQPAEGAAHCPVRPEYIVIAGDFNGNGLSLALL